jgi:maleate cis-trans isomerase
MAIELDSSDAEAIFISCANLATLDVIEKIEADLGKPVVTSNTACFWACLRAIGVDARVEGYGRLLREVTVARAAGGRRPGQEEESPPENLPREMEPR